MFNSSWFALLHVLSIAHHQWKVKPFSKNFFWSRRVESNHILGLIWTKAL